jgi:TrpR family trp operon transcriptional repressor
MKNLHEIARVLAKTHDAKTISAFLAGILTANEIAEISSRWELVKLLEQGQSQRRISRKLKLSLCKITRGSHELKKKDSAFRHMIHLHFEQRKRQSPDRHVKKQAPQA